MTSLYNQLLSAVDKLPLSRSLMKVLSTTQELKDRELEKWVQLELHGYWNTNPALTEEVVVPAYRTVAGYYTDDFGRRFLISDPKLSFINEIRLRFGVVELEGLTGSKGPLTIRPLEFTELIRESISVEVTTFNFSPSTIIPVLAAIRTQLVEYLILRKDKLSGKVNVPMSSRTDDIIELKPNFYGVGVDLRALFRKLQDRGK